MATIKDFKKRYGYDDPCLCPTHAKFYNVKPQCPELHDLQRDEIVECDICSLNIMKRSGALWKIHYYLLLVDHGNHQITKGNWFSILLELSKVLWLATSTNSRTRHRRNPQSKWTGVKNQTSDVQERPHKTCKTKSFLTSKRAILTILAYSSSFRH